MAIVMYKWKRNATVQTTNETGLTVHGRFFTLAAAGANETKPPR